MTDGLCSGIVMTTGADMADLVSPNRPAAFLAASAAIPASADVYAWRDKDGRLVVSDRPAGPGAADSLSRWVDQPDDAAVRDRDPLGPAGRARGVEDVGEVVRRHRHGRAAGAARRDRLAIAVHRHQPRSLQACEPAEVRGARDHQRRQSRPAMSNTRSLGFVTDVARHVNALGWDIYATDHEDGNGQYEFEGETNGQGEWQGEWMGETDGEMFQRP